jgi:hypothetical protein
MADHLVKPLSAASVDAIIERWIAPFIEPETSPIHAAAT